jgi:hypothetical protein
LVFVFQLAVFTVIVILGQIIVEKNGQHLLKAVGQAVMNEILAIDPEDLTLLGGAKLTGKAVGLKEKDDVTGAAVSRKKLFDTAEVGVLDGESCFLSYLAYNRVDEGFPRFYVSAREGEARPRRIVSPFNEDIIAVENHAHIG